MGDLQKYNDKDVPDLFKTAELLHRSGMFPSARSAAGIFCICEYGRELNIPPVMSLQSISVVKGRLCMSSGAMLTLASRNGVRMEVIEETSTKCALKFIKGDVTYVSSFTMTEAREAGLVKKDSAWEKYPKDLLFARAVTRGIRRINPGAILGLYDPEEIASIPSESTPEKSTQSEIHKTLPDEPVDSDDFLSDDTDTSAVDEPGVTGEGGDGISDDVSEDETIPEYPASDSTPKLPVEGDARPPSKQDDGRISNAEAAVKMLRNARKGPAITDPQMKRIHAILSHSGFAPLYDFFKMYLFKIGYLNNPKTLKKATTVLLAKKIMDDFNMHIRNIFSIQQFHDPMKKHFTTITKKSQVKLLLGMGGFIHELASTPSKITEESTDKQLNDYFGLFLTTLLHQKDPGVDQMYKMLTTSKDLIKEGKK